MVVEVWPSSPAGPDECPLMGGGAGSTVAGTDVGAGVSSCGNASLSVTEADIVHQDVVGPQKGDDVAEKALHIWIK